MPLIMSAKAKRFMSMPGLAAGFAARVEQYELGAASTATDMSRRMSRRFTSGRPLAASRSGRPTTGGTFQNYLEWQADATTGMITFDLGAAEAAAPYWLILEIGTGQGANILGSTAGQATVKSQRGRHIPWSLYWGNGPGAVPVRRMSGKQRIANNGGMQQLYPISGLPAGTPRPGSGGLIRREIKGKHYIQYGGIAGFEQLRDDILSDARKTFG